MLIQVYLIWLIFTGDSLRNTTILRFCIVMLRVVMLSKYNFLDNDKV